MMKDSAFNLAYARSRKRQKLVPESQKSLESKLNEIAKDLDLGKPVSATINGVEFDLYPISALAFSAGRSPTTLRMWEKDKILPKATFRTKSNKRLYHPLQIALVVHLQDKHDIGQGKNLKDSDFVTDLREKWAKVKITIFKGGEESGKEKQTTGSPEKETSSGNTRQQKALG